MRSAIALGNAPVISRHYRVLRRLADFGFFAAGGLLVGTHAFLAYGNMLGVAWGDATRTQDIDFAHAGKKVSLALPSNLQVNTHGAIESLKMGFLPAQGLASYVNPKEPDFRIDFLTTLHRGGDEPFEHPQLKVSLQPLRFMEFSLEQVEQALCSRTKELSSSIFQALFAMLCTRFSLQVNAAAVLRPSRQRIYSSQQPCLRCCASYARKK